MKNKLLVSGVIAASVWTTGLGVAVLVKSTASENDICQQLIQESQSPHCTQIANNSELSWGQWITGNSQSGQFHFLDLLELISRYTSENHIQQYSSRPSR